MKKPLRTVTVFKPQRQDGEKHAEVGNRERRRYDSHMEGLLQLPSGFKAI